MAQLDVVAMLHSTAQHVACMRQGNCPQESAYINAPKNVEVLYVHDHNELSGLPM